MSSSPGPAPQRPCSNKIGIMSHHMIGNEKDWAYNMKELGRVKACPLCPGFRPMSTNGGTRVGQ